MNHLLHAHDSSSRTYWLRRHESGIRNQAAERFRCDDQIRRVHHISVYIGTGPLLSNQKSENTIYKIMEFEVIYINLLL